MNWTREDQKRYNEKVRYIKNRMDEAGGIEPYRELLISEFRDAVAEIDLTETEAEIVIMYFGLQQGVAPMTYVNIVRMLGVTMSEALGAVNKVLRVVQGTSWKDHHLLSEVKLLNPRIRKCGSIIWDIRHRLDKKG